MPRLKVFCSTSGFHDSIVAAPSRPAALKAWGAKTDLFSMGVARQVTDPKIIKQALARPGEVISISRSGKGGDKAPAPSKAKPKRRAARPPSRIRLAAAERQLEALEGKQAKALEAVERELAALARKREQLEKRHATARREAEEKVADARDAYQSALDEWEG